MNSIIRVPNHLGDVVMALPALAEAPDADLLTRPPFVPLLALAGRSGRILTLEPTRRGFFRAAKQLRRRSYDRGVLLTPSFSSALLFRAGGVRERRGTATDARTFLLTDALPPNRLKKMHRRTSYRILVRGGDPETEPPRARLAVPESAREDWRRRAGAAHCRNGRSILNEPTERGGGANRHLQTDRPIVGVVPGSRAGSRRWEPDRWAELVRRLTADRVHVIVFGAPDERALTERVAGADAYDAGGSTDLARLAAGLAACDLVIGSDSGGVHLAAAVGTPTVSLSGADDPAVTGVLGPEHRRLRRPDLPCVPCVRNECRRRGAGTFLPRAERECMRLIGVDDVERAVRERLAVVC